MEKKRGIIHLDSKEVGKMKDALSSMLETYGKGNELVKEDGLRILGSWGRIVFIISNDGKRIGLELTERWERESNAD